MLNYAKINLGNEFNVEYSHHYGVKNFSKIGCILIDILIEVLQKNTYPTTRSGPPFSLSQIKGGDFSNPFR